MSTDVVTIIFALLLFMAGIIPIVLGLIMNYNEQKAHDEFYRNSEESDEG